MFLFSLLQSSSAAPGNHLTNVTGLNGAVQTYAGRFLFEAKRSMISQSRWGGTASALLSSPWEDLP